MDPTWRFLVFVGFAAVSLGLGYGCRRAGWLRESDSRRVHYHTVVWTWTLTAWIALWGLPISASAGWIALWQAVATIVPAVGMIAVGKWLGRPRDQIGVLSIAGAVTNIGYTLGAYLCFAMLTPGVTALAYAGVATSTLAVCIILVLYPIAVHFGQAPGAVKLPELIARSFLRPPALPLYASLLGLTLAALGTHPPTFVDDWYLRDVMQYLLTFGTHFGIGLCFRVRDLRFEWDVQLALAASCFVVVPALGAVTVFAAGLVGASGGIAPMGGMDALAVRVVQIESFMPVGVSCILLSNVFGLDARLGVRLWVWNTLLFTLLVLPWLLIWLARP